MRTTLRSITLDVGGTFVKSSDGRKVPIDSSGGREGIIASLREAVGETEGLGSVGVCIPGPFDYRKGIFLMKHKFAAVYGESFRSLAGIPERVRMSFVHDVVAPLAGILRLHPETGDGVVALVTLGTGLGFSHAVDGEVQTTELLSPSVSRYNRPYRDGVLEDYVSRRGILKAYGKPAEGDVSGIAGMARAGDEEAREAFLSCGRSLAEGAGNLFRELNIRHIFFGGQISKSFDLLEPALKEALPDIGMSEIKDFEEAVMAGAAVVRKPRC